jgi:hypothetical protein
MSASYQDVDEIIILVDIEDPMTYDPEFQNRIQYGSFVKMNSEFSPDSRDLVRSNVDDDELTNNKFFIEIYTDRLDDFVRTVLYNQDWQRALIFREERITGPEPELSLVDPTDDELADACTIHHYYELKTVARMPVDPSLIDDDEDEEASGEGDDEDGKALGAELDKFPSLFLPESKTLH